MILTLLLLLAMTFTAAIVVKNRSKKQDKETTKNQYVDYISISLESEKQTEPSVETEHDVTPIDQPKKKRKYHKKKQPKKMDANKK